jgi:hypothetical protein
MGVNLFFILSGVAAANNVFQAGIALILVALLRRPADRAANPLLAPLELAGMMCFSLQVWHGVTLSRINASDFTATSLAKYSLALGAVAWLSYRHVGLGSVRDWRLLAPRNALPARYRPGEEPQGSKVGAPKYARDNVRN